MAKETHKDLEVKSFRSQAPLLTWFSKNHEMPAGIWIKFAKKNSGLRTVT